MTAPPAYVGRGEGRRALVFLHGIGGDAHTWAAQLEDLSDVHRCIAWSAPGYGGSPPIDPFDWAGLSDALGRLLDHLDLEDAVLVGHSMGGMIAQDFACRYAGRVRALVLSGTSPAFGRADGDFQRRFVAERTAPLDSGLGMDALAARLVPDLLGSDPAPGARGAAERAMAAVPPATYRVALANLVTFDRRADLARLAVPVMLVAGEANRTAPAAMMARMAGKIPGARFVTIPSAGHLAPMERPGDYNRAVREFIDALED